MSEILCITVQAVNLKINLIACAPKANLAPSADCNKLQVLKTQLNEPVAMRFPTMWHFDMCRLGRASAASF